MIRFLTTAAILAAASGPVWAQSATGVGVGTGTGIGVAKSQSTAVGGGVGNTGTINAAPTSNVTIGGAPATSNSVITTQGKTSVSTVPSVFAPGLAAAGLETCLGSVSVGAS